MDYCANCHFYVTVLYHITFSCLISAEYIKQRSYYDPGELREYCEFETFEPQCFNNDLIVMKAALYGRMRLGKCVEANLGYLGCSKDVLNVADKMCSGKRQCSIKVPNPDFDQGKKPCYKELKSYLEASYSCHSVIQPDFVGCTILLTSNPSRITIPAWQRETCGSEAKPWIVETFSGQRLNVSLVDFSSATTATRYTEPTSSGLSKIFTEPSQNKLNDKCTRTLATVLDINSNKHQEICGDSAHRERWLLESTGNQVHVILKSAWPSDKSTLNDSSFLIQFEVTGCADLKAPADGWLKREGNDLTVGCHSTRQTWHLFCEGRRWNGVIGNCTTRFTAASKAALMDGHNSLTSPQVLAVLTVAGISLALCCTIVCMGIVCYKRFAEKDRQRYAAKAQIRYDNVASEDEQAQAYHIHCATYKQTDDRNGSIYRKNGYKHVWERPLPQPSNIDAHGPSDPSYMPGDSGLIHNDYPQDSFIPLNNDDLDICNSL